MIEIKHENGCKAIIHNPTSMTIISPDGSEYFRYGIDEEDNIMELLERHPAFIEKFRKELRDDGIND